MDVHLQPEEDERRFKCGECGRAYRHAGSLANHRKTHDVGIFQCNICGKENSNALALKNHLRSHTSQKKYPCLECGKAFRRPSQLVIHERSHVSEQAEEFSVSEGDMECVTQKDQNGHAHCFPSSGISTQICPSDDTTDVAFNTQAESSDSDRPFKCDLCDKSYLHHGSLSNHIKTHQTGTFECSVCFRQFNNMAALHNHQRTHKSKSQVDSFIGPTLLDQFLPQSQDVPVNFCHLCQVLFSCEEEFREHIQIHNSSPLAEQNDVLYDNRTAFSESRLNPVFPFARGHSESFDLPNELIPTNGHFYDCANLDTSPLDNTETGLSPFIAQNPNSIDTTSPVDSDKRPYRCDICCKTYRHYGSLVNHKRSHQVGNYQCSICEKNCPNLAAFKSHIRIHKTAANLLRRQDPQLSDEQQTSEDHGLPEHQNGFGLDGHLNLDCSQTFGDFADFKMQNCLSVQQQEFTSDGFNGSSDHLQDQDVALGLSGDLIQNDLIQNDPFLEKATNHHLSCDVANELEEDDRDFFQCSVCGSRYSNVKDLKSHMQEHTNIPSIPSPTSISSQIKKEELGDTIICCLCGESFSNSQDLVNHQLRHSTDHFDNGPNCDNKKCEETSRNLICGKCGIICTSLGHLENHGCEVDTNRPTVESAEEMKEQDNYAEAGLVEEERQFKCEECGRSYRHSGSLLNHKKSHKTGLFRCHVCQKSFYNLLALKNHQRSHFDVKRFKCDECGKAFRTQKQLLNHQRRHNKDAQVKSKLPALVQMNESESDGGIQSSSTNSSQDLPSENPHEELKERNATNESADSGDKRPFTCDQCGRSYRHAGSLANHRNSHKTGEYLCSVCNNAYSNQLALKNHLRTHFAFQRHSCPKCGKKLRSRKQLSVHVCSTLKRRRGSKSNKSTTALVSGKSSDALGKEERPFTCGVCNRSYRHASSLLNHKNTHKTGRYSCTFCSKQFTNPMALRNHTRIHTQKKRYVCLTCGKAFRVASVLYNHQRVHMSRFSCDDCGASFRGRAALHRHRCSTGQRSGKEDRRSTRPDKCFKCDLCGRSYRHAGSLLTHKKTHSENLHHCTLCLQTFPNALALDAHSQLTRHSCPECGKTFCLLPHLQSHMEVHGKDRNADQGLCEEDRDKTPPQSPPPPKVDSGKVHVCEHCGRVYRHAGSLLNHKNSHKTGHFSCSVCLKEFTNLMALKNHRRIHTEPKRYQCLECGKAFRVSSQLICHRRIHTREKPFACSVCDRSFSSKSNLKQHEKMHHSGIEQPFGTDADEFMDLDISAYL